MPLCDDAPAPRNAPAGHVRAPDRSPAPAPVVLLLNGSDPLRAAMGLQLTLWGYVVKTAATTAEALALISRGGVDAAIAEHLVYGLNATDLLRGLSRAGTVPVILITESAAVRLLPQDTLPAVAEVLVRNRFSLTELGRALAKIVRRP